MSEKLTDTEAQEMLNKLTQHFRQVVLPVNKYCEAFEIYANILIEKHENSDEQRDKDFVHFVERARLNIHKSNLLFRLIYLDQPLRKEKCPIHKGIWSGQAQCLYGCVLGCDGTGYLKEPEMIQSWLENVRKNYAKTDEELLELIQEYTDANCFPKQSDDRYFKWRTYFEWANHIGYGHMIPENEKY